MIGSWLRIRQKGRFPATEYSGIGERQLRDLIKHEKIPAIRLPGGALVVHRQWLDEYLLRHQIGSMADRAVDEVLKELAR